MSSVRRFDDLYASEKVKSHLEAFHHWLLEAARGLDLEKNHWLCLMNALMCLYCQSRVNLQPGILEDEVEEFAEYEPEDFAQWEVELSDLLGRIRPLGEFERLALLYRVRWLFTIPQEERDRILGQ